MEKENLRQLKERRKSDIIEKNDFQEGGGGVIDISGHLRDCRRDTGFADDCSPLVVNCCGYQQFRTRDFSRSRPGGRLDYQLIYVMNGCGSFELNGEKKTARAGEVILYRPGEPQIYSYHHEDAPLVYWIHFTGTRVEELLERYHIRSGMVGCSTVLRTVFEEILLELTLKKQNFEEVVVSSFCRLLALMERVRMENENRSACRLPIDDLIVKLNLTYQQSWTLASMAEFCMMSEGYFSHSFKKLMNRTPMQYLTDLRISKAKDFLVSSRMPVASVASAVGYENPLYFSRVFRSSEGMSPTQYRLQQEKEA